jgi:hypothetical protein
MSEQTLPFSGTTPISRHHSAQAADRAAVTRGKRTREYLELLAHIGPAGVTDHDAARMLGLPLSSVNSIRNGCGALIVPAETAGQSPYGRTVTRWKRSS